MLNRQKSLRTSFIAIAIILTTGLIFAASGGFGLLSFNLASASNNQETVKQTTAPMTIGTCDTAGPVEVEATVGTLGPTAYATLKLAFDAINAGTHQGVINVEVCGSTTETTTPAVLNSNGAGPALYTSVLVRPLVDGASIMGITAAGRGLIELNAADNVTIDGDNPNSGGINRNLTLQNTAASTTTYAQVIRIALATTVANTADNNTFKNLIILGHATGRNAAGITSTTGSENASYGILANAGASTTDGTVAPTAITSVSTVIGSGATATNLTIQNNSITTAARGIAIQGSATTVFPGLLIENNTVGNAAAGATDGVYSQGMTLQGSTSAIVRGNTVHVESYLGTSVRGISHGSISATGTGATIEKNFIARVWTNSTSGFGAYGICLEGGTGHIVQNNFIYNINGFMNNSAISTTFGPHGIRISSGTGHTVYNNSINLVGAFIGATTTSLASGFTITSTALTGINVRNNIFVNTMTGAFSASTPVVAIYLPSGGTSAMNLTLNNNDYVQGSGTGAALAQVGTTSGTGVYLAANFDPTMTTPATNFRAYTSTLLAANTDNDNASLKIDPAFVSSTDLHIPGTSPVINFGATIGTVTTDIDGDARPIGGAYEIGADERAAVAAPGTLQFSSATYGGSEGSTLVATVNRVAGTTGTVGVTVTLTDGTGAGGAACTAGVDYVNPGPQLLSFGDSVPSQPVNVTLCSDGAVLDPGETFTLTLSAPTGGASLGSPTVATATITDIPPPFNGSYNVGAAETYTSLTNPGGIFEAINLAGSFSGNVTINITSDLSGETGVVALNEFAGGFTLTIKPSGAARTITGSSTTNIIRINGADNVTIDGSLTGATAAGQVGGDASIRNLTIQNTSTTATAGAVIAVMTGTNGAQNDTVKNVNIIGQAFNQTLIGLHMGGNTVGSAGTDNDNNRVENNSFQKAFIGLYNTGASAANQNTGNVVTMNDLSFTGTDRLRRAGMLFFNHDGLQVTLNSIGGITSDEGIDSYGIGLGTQDATTTTTTSGAITNALVSRNKINGVASTSTTGFSSFGIGVAGGTTGPNTISNNMISGVTAPSTSPDNPYGIFIAGATSSNTQVYFNSISMTGDRGGTSTSQMPSFGIAITGASPVVELKNNIFYNTQTSAIGGAGAESYSIGMVAAGGTNLSSDFNDFFTSGANSSGWRSGSLAASAGVDYATLALWTAAIGDDASSQEVDPLFINPLNDLHLNGATPSPLLGDGVAIGTVTNDFDNDPRPAANPDIGADEIVQSVAAIIPGGTFYNVRTNPGDTLGGNVTVTGNMTFFGVLNDGGFTLTFGCGATTSNQGAFNYFTGNVIKNFCGAESFLFPVGTFPDGSTIGNASEYTPVLANVTAIGVNPSSLAVQSFDFTLFPFNAATSVDRNWALIETGDITADLSFTYIDGDVNGNEADYRVWWRNVNTPTNLCPVAPCINTGTNTAGPVLGVTQFSRWTVAEALGPVAAHVNVGGRVLMADGLQGLPRVQVVLSGGDLPEPRVVMTNPFGYFNFEDLEVGRTYVLTVGSKQYTFMNPTIVVTPDDNVTNANFFANP